MTAKENAEQLVEKFRQLDIDGMDWGEAKQCALILVEEIRKELLAQYNRHYSEDTQVEIGYWCNSDECKFWTDVNEEIKSL